MMRPLFDAVLVRLTDAPSTSPLYTPDAWRAAPTTGEVVALGSGRALPDGSRLAPSVQVGDQVFFAAGQGEPVTLADGERALLLRETALLATYER